MNLQQIKAELAEMDAAYAASEVNYTAETKARFDAARHTVHMNLSAKLHMLIELAEATTNRKTEG